MSPEVARQRLEAGQPLISFAELILDEALLKDTFSKVLAIFRSYPELFEQLPAGLPADLAALVKAWFEGTESVAEPLASIIHATLKPFLVSQARVMRPLIDPARWRRGYCPVCGGRPDFAYLEKEFGNRWLACARCDTEWLFQRLECPFCGTQNQNALAYFTDETGLYRLYVCEKCRGYLKAIDLRQTRAEVLLPLERLETLDLDRQALEQGYTGKK